MALRARALARLWLQPALRVLSGRRVAETGLFEAGEGLSEAGERLSETGEGLS